MNDGEAKRLEVALKILRHKILHTKHSITWG